MRLLSTFLLFISISLSGYSQSNYIVVNDINYLGLHKTNEIVVQQELDFLVGDTINLLKLDQVFRSNQKRLLGTSLFTEAYFNIKNWDTESNYGDIEITLKENLMIYPSIIFEYADRDFNVWWKEFNFSLRRVNYGVRVDHLSLTGRKDKLKLKFQTGYTDKYELEYLYPYLKGGWGFGFGAFYSSNKEIGYITTDNRPIFRSEADERILLTRFRAGVSLSNRRNAYSNTNIRLEYHSNTVDDIVLEEYNPNYFIHQGNNLRFFYLEYDWQYDKRISPVYPEGGHLLFANIKKEGFGIYKDYNNLSISIGGEKYWEIGKNLIYGGRFKAKSNLIRNTLAFANNTGLGWNGDFVRGYELYVQDGPDFALLRTDLKWKAWSRTFNLGKYMPLSAFRNVPVEVWLRHSFDSGYVHEPTYTATNDLNNTLLVGGGPAIDIIFYHTMTLKTEYNFNQLGEGGLFFQFSFNF